jgi:CheY-like chemotaxis protein
MSEPLNILFVDDELVPGQSAPDGNYMWYYVKALLDAGFQVTEADTTDAAFERLAVTETPFHLVILDVMLAPGRMLQDEDTQQGTRTGIVMAQRFRRMFDDIPIVVFTQYRRPEITSALQKIPRCRVLLKDDYTPEKLAEELIKILRP